MKNLEVVLKIVLVIMAMSLCIMGTCAMAQIIAQYPSLVLEVYVCGAIITVLITVFTYQELEKV